MLFKRKHQLGKNKVWGFTCILFLFVVNLYAITNPVEIYKNNKKQILEKKNITLDGFCFSVGFCYPKTITASSRNGAIRKSSFLATSNIYKIIMDKIEWPESISAQLKNSIFEEYIKLSDIHISLLKLQTVDTGRIGKEYYTVKAVPEDNIKTPTISYQDIYNTIEKA